MIVNVASVSIHAYLCLIHTAAANINNQFSGPVTVSFMISMVLFKLLRLCRWSRAVWRTNHVIIFEVSEETTPTHLPQMFCRGWERYG